MENAASSRGFATALYIKRYAFVVDYNFGVLAAVVLSVVELAEILAQRAKRYRSGSATRRGALMTRASRISIGDAARCDRILYRDACVRACMRDATHR